LGEASRFLRYVTPVGLFGLEVLSFLYLLTPWEIKRGDLNQVLDGDKGIALLIGAALASGGLGLLCSSVHHALFWLVPCWGIDYTDFVFRTEIAFPQQFAVLARANHGPYAKPFIDIKIPRFIHRWHQGVLNRRFALSTLGSLWHHFRSQCDGFEQAHERLKSFGDLMHGLGTAVVTTVAAFITTIIIASHVAEPATKNLERFHGSLAVLLASSIVALLAINYRNTKMLTKEYFEGAIWAALYEDRRAKLVGTQIQIQVSGTVATTKTL
jgi:hypothetical protein